jgi:NAD(P)-dependent dehydrogenase (short-subunit alcohol dehydrogenase family)
LAKFGVVGFVLAKRLAPDEIRVNAICPGPIDAPMLRAFMLKFMSALHDLKRRGHFEKVGHGIGVRWKLALQGPELI